MQRKIVMDIKNRKLTAENAINNGFIPLMQGAS
jgi:hypothetical protein